MGTIRRFEDLEAWKKARELADAIYKASSKGEFVRDFVLRDQVRRAVVSISSNIAEGFERSGRSEFIQFLSIAKGSCGELRSQLYLALDQNYFTQDEFNLLLEDVTSTSSLIAGLMKYLRQSGIAGSKYKTTVPVS